MDMEYKIRKMTEDDLDAVMALLGEWNMAPVEPDENNPDPERSTIQIEHTFIAEKENKVVGVGSYLLLSDTVAETASLAVDPSQRGTGIGYALQVARIDEMKKRGITRVVTETDRPETIDWYINKFGYKKVGSHKKKHAFSRTDIDSWTILELELKNDE
jgi:N-acetylglutamate synthase-like GNAT family acetyltransferase